MKDDKIKGFRIGIDDYITKPFDGDELYCRIMAIVNRVNQGNLKQAGGIRIEIGKYSFYPGGQCLKDRDKEIRLTIKESKILCMLASHINELVSREDIMKEVWGEYDYYTGRSLDVFISKIRNYLKQDPSIKIITIPTSGYILEIKNNS